jgi:ubiquitin C-terminal hydrolase
MRQDSNVLINICIHKTHNVLKRQQYHLVVSKDESLSLADEMTSRKFSHGQTKQVFDRFGFGSLVDIFSMMINLLLALSEGSM